MEVHKGIYGLHHSGLIAQYLLEERFHKNGYHQSNYTPVLWTHASLPIYFSLVVDEFGVTYVGKENTDHLIKVLEEHYTLTKYWSGAK